MNKYGYSYGLTEEEKAYQEHLNDCLDACSCGKTIWKLHDIAPSNARFTVQVLREVSNEVLDTVSFRKDDAGEKESGEAKLRALIRKIYHVHGRNYPYPRITSEFTYGFGIVYAVRVYV